MSEAGRLYPPEGVPPLGPPAWPPPPPGPPPRRRRWWPPVMAVAVLAVAIAAAVAIAQVAGDGDGDTDRSAPATTESASRTTLDAPARTAPANPGGGTAFSDPQGTYTITLGPGWTELPSMMVAEVETWAVADAVDGFTPNVNVLTQDAPGMDQDEYMQLSLAGLDSIDAEIVDQAFVTGSDGNPLGLIEYIAQPPGVRSELHFVGVFDVQDGTAIVGTFTAPLDEFGELWPAAEPYLLTLEATE